MENHEHSFFKNLLSCYEKIKQKYSARHELRNLHELKETKEIYTIHSKKYTKERHSMHKKIVGMIEETGTFPEQGKKPIAILMGGGTASGKTTMRNKIEMDLAASNIYATTVDLDEIKEYIPEYAVYKKTSPNQAARLVHKESCDIGALLLSKLIKSRKNLIYEGTMAKTRKYEWLVKKLKQNNYEIHAYVVNVPLSVAKERADERARTTGRIVPNYIIEYTHKLAPRTFEVIKDLLDSYRVYENQNGLELIASNHFVDPRKYEEFLKKGNVNFRIRSKITNIKNMFHKAPKHLDSINPEIDQQKNKEVYIFIDDCYSCDILAREYPNME